MSRMRPPAILLLVSMSLAVTDLSGLSAIAANYRAEKIDEPAPSDGLAPEIAKSLSPTGYRVIKGSSRAVCEIWLCKQWNVTDAEPTSEVSYPFRRGQLIGVAHYPRDGGDFRDQPIDPGLYTLRYELQPIDGDHVGTSVTRDFLLLIAAGADTKPDDLAEEPLNELSAEAVGSSHPGMLALKPVTGDGKPGSLREDEENEWTMLRVQGKAIVDGKPKELTFDVVVVGFALE